MAKLILPKIAGEISDAIFGNAPPPPGCRKIILRKGLRALDCGKVGGQPLRFIEQNPHTRSRFANLARSGRKIIWAFLGNNYWSDTGGTKGIVDGEWKDSMHDI